MKKWITRLQMVVFVLILVVQFQNCKISSFEVSKQSNAAASSAPPPEPEGSTTKEIKEIIGQLNSIKIAENKIVLDGWACLRQAAGVVKINVLVGMMGQQLTKDSLAMTPLASGSANLVSDAETVEKCGRGNNHTFHIEIDKEDADWAQGLPVRLEAQSIDDLNVKKDLPAPTTPLTIPFDTAVDQLLLPGMPAIYMTAKQLKAILNRPPASVQSPVWSSKIMSQANWTLTYVDMTAQDFLPYLGTSSDSFNASVSRSLSKVPFLALVCLTTPSSDRSRFCQKGIEILLSWAQTTKEESQSVADCPALPPRGPVPAGATLYCPGSSLKPDLDPSVQAGLTLGRHLGQIGESYRLLARFMNASERLTIKNWIHELGLTVKKSHQQFMKRAPEEGIANHHSWHNFGMAVAALLTEDAQLLSYALVDPANKVESPDLNMEVNFVNALNVAIYEADNSANVFRLGYEMGGNAFTQTGEMWDRFRHLACGHANIPQGCGFAYSTFNLLALTSTAYLMNNSGLIHHGQSFANAVDLQSPSVTSPALLNAIRFTGKYFLTPTVPITDNTNYLNEYVSPTHFGLFMMGKQFYLNPSDQELFRNILNAGAPSFRAGDATYPLDGMPTAYLSIIFGLY